MTSAETLMQVYQQALMNDPTFKKAQADWRAAQENLSLARSGNGKAGSGLFPYINLNAQINRTHQSVDWGNVSGNGDYSGNAYLLNLTQPIFNYATWKSISSAKFSVKAATATYLAAAQNLMFRTAQSYFVALQAWDQLAYTREQKKSDYTQWVIAKQKFAVGLVAKTEVYEAQAQYDQTKAQEIADKNTLASKLEELRAITGHLYDSLAPLRRVIPLVLPTPRHIDSWVAIATKQNYTLQSNLYTMLADQENVKAAAAGRYPSLTGTAAFGGATVGVPGLETATSNNLQTLKTTFGLIGLNLSFPVYQGGYVTHKTKQARYNYLSASQQLDFTHRDVIRQTREAYLTVDSSIHKINADHATIASQNSKLQTTVAGHRAGTRTMSDVLDAISDFYQATSQWSEDRYSYVINILALKEQAGTLSPQDLSQMESWLDHSVSLTKRSLSVSSRNTPKTSHLFVAKKILSKQCMRYGIQLIATHDKAEALWLQERYPKSVIKTQESWYKLIWKQYPSRQAAQRALNDLPTSLKKNNPWVVPLHCAG